MWEQESLQQVQLYGPTLTSPKSLPDLKREDKRRDLWLSLILEPVRGQIKNRTEMQQRAYLFKTSRRDHLDVPRAGRGFEKTSKRRGRKPRRRNRAGRQKEPKDATDEDIQLSQTATSNRKGTARRNDAQSQIDAEIAQRKAQRRLSQFRRMSSRMSSHANKVGEAGMPNQVPANAKEALQEPVEPRSTVKDPAQKQTLTKNTIQAIGAAVNEAPSATAGRTPPVDVVKDLPVVKASASNLSLNAPSWKVLEEKVAHSNRQTSIQRRPSVLGGKVSEFTVTANLVAEVRSSSYCSHACFTRSCLFFCM
jgi:hypothetical protein